MGVGEPGIQRILQMPLTGVQFMISRQIRQGEACGMQIRQIGSGGLKAEISLRGKAPIQQVYENVLRRFK